MFITFFTNGAITHAGWKASYSVSAVGMEEEQQDQMKVFPNPASDRLFIQLTSRAPAHVQLLDSRGKLVNRTTFQYTSDHIIMDVGEAGPGLYLLEVLQGAERMTKKIILR